MMHAASLFGQHKDAAAMAEYHQASLKPFWREYYSEEVYGNWKKWDLAAGMRSAMMHEAIFESLLLPHYGALRQAARIELYKAMMAERSGNAKQGLEIRLDIMRCGSLIRSQSTTVIGSLVGIAVFRTGQANLGGRPDSSDNSELSSEKTSGQRFVDFCTYLVRTKNADLVTPVTTEFDAGMYIHNSGLDNVEKANPAMSRLVVLSAGDYLLLANVVMLLITGALATAALCILKQRPIQAFSRSLTPILLAGLILGIAVSMLSITPSRYVLVASLLSVVALVPILVWVCIHVGRHYTIKGISVVLGLAATMFALFCILLFEQGKCNGIVEAGGMLGGAVGLWYLAGVVLFYLPVPAVVLVAMFRTIIRRMPVLTGTLDGVTKSTSLIACILILIYGVVFLGTVRQERLVNLQVDQQTACEGQYNAAMAGHTWPGPTNWSSSEMPDPVLRHTLIRL